MLIKLRCSKCMRKVSAEDDLLGKKVLCPACDSVIPLPSPQFGFGKQIKGYAIEQWLGAGNCGEVYLAKQIAMNRHVALKVMKASEDLIELNVIKHIIGQFVHITLEFGCQIVQFEILI